MTQEKGFPVDQLLSWYDCERRVLPWRAMPGEQPDPYHVWVSEVMLQQTVVKTVIPYFLTFIRQWPRVVDLSEAPIRDVLASWAGLGYYARARNMHACALSVCDQFGALFPESSSALLSLPGIGLYTMAAIRAIAYGHQIVPVDSNIERITVRYHAIETPLPSVKQEVHELAQGFLPCSRPGDLAQALMDLGAMVCTPRNPSCASCPLQSGCAAWSRSLTTTIPHKKAKKRRSVLYASVFWLESSKGVLVRSRPNKGLLGGMTEFPSGAWVEKTLFRSGEQDAPVRAEWSRLPGHVYHKFTHFDLIIEVWRAKTDIDVKFSEKSSKACSRFVCKEALEFEALPSVMRKIVAHAFSCEPNFLSGG
ncbi:MAG: A/G-specific adenine glycosylase [Alphaproteobacteria bacterium]|nr:A/G-specific adenine glycosylase [Alphaproteobacteria bacterium]